MLEILAAFSRTCGWTLPHVIAPRRAGDLAAYWADASRAEQELVWSATRDLDDMCADTWRWQSLNPMGYPS